MSYAIQWDLLSVDELDVLEEAGVEMHPTGMNFKRTPTWEEFTLVFAYLCALENRTVQEGNHILCAIGDCLNAGEEFFGWDKVDKWLKEFFPLIEMRDHILKMAGGTLIFLQMVELQIKVCCAQVSLEGLKLTWDDVFSPDPSRRKQTLGQLARALKRSDAFDPEFEDRLTKFVNARNQFIHNLWVKQLFEETNHNAKTSGFPSKEQFEEIYEFIRSLIRQAYYMQNVFQGFFYELGRAKYPELRKMEQDQTFPLRRWARYIPEFREVLRKESETNQQ
jgi:hypothetical protein